KGREWPGRRRARTAMTCPRCQAQAPEDVRFCEECGARLALACPQCGAEISPGKKFCCSCGAALSGHPPDRSLSPASYTPRHLAGKILTSRAVLEGGRKKVPVLFADLKGSIERLADNDPRRPASSWTLSSSGCEVPPATLLGVARLGCVRQMV